MSSNHDNAEQKSNIEDSLDEEDRLTCRERWAKKEKLNLPSCFNNYQSSANVNLAKKKVAKDILMKAKKMSLRSSKRKLANKSKIFLSIEFILLIKYFFL